MYAAVETLAHYFYPRYSNNHKAKLLHSSTLFFLILVLVAYQFLLQFSPSWGLRILGYASSIPPEQVISLTNQKRQSSGLQPLEFNTTLSQAAEAKGRDMLAKGYWAHVAPDGTEPWKFFVDVGYKYKYAGENLARDFSNPASAVEAWMASPSHRENMLSPKYKDIGVAVVEGNLAGVDTTIVVQLFGTRQAEASQVTVAKASTETEAQVAISPTPQVTPTPSKLPEFFVQVSPQPTPVFEQTSSGGVAQEQKPSLLISPFDTTRGVSLATVILLLLVFVVDAIVVSRRKIPRIGGRTFAHLAFLGMLLALVLIAKAGKIL